MRAHFVVGERGQAMETYEACPALLAAELSVEPEPGTEALAARIRSQHVLQPQAPRPYWLDTLVNFLENVSAGRSTEHQMLVERYFRAAGQP